MNIIEALKNNNYKLSTAESMTGGLIAARVCEISGASNFFNGGVVTYSKEAKCKLLGLKMDDINKYGVYSNETVISMAKGIKDATNSDVAIAISGVAGPGSDEGVEAGSVYFCIMINEKPHTYFKQFSGSRNEVRDLAASFIIEEAIRLLS